MFFKILLCINIVVNENIGINVKMGNYISNNTLYLSAKRLVSKYNIESRTFKELEKQSKKPLAAPKHEAGIIDYHKSLKGENITLIMFYTIFYIDFLHFKLNSIYILLKL